MKIKVVLILLLLTVEHIIADNINKGEVIEIRTKYNGYNILLVYDSLTTECSKFEAMNIDSSTILYDAVIQHNQSDQFGLSVKCAENDNSFGYLLIRTNSQSKNPRVDRYYFYTKAEYNKIQIKNEQEKRDMITYWISAAIIFPIVAYIFWYMPLQDK